MASHRGGTAGSKRRPPDQARSSLLAAADRLFYAHGVRAVGVDAVADAAGVTKRTLYYHFPTKEALVQAYLEARDAPTRAALEKVAAEHPLPGDRILATFDYLERWFATPGYHGCPFNNAAAEHVGDQAAAIVRRHKTAMAGWFSDQAQLGGARSPKQLGAALLVVMDGALNGAMIFESAEAASTARSIAAMLLADAGVETSTARPAGRQRSVRARG